MWIVGRDTMPKHKLTQELLEKWAKEKAEAWAWENYAPNDRAYAEYDLEDSWFDLEEYEDGTKEYDGEIMLKVTIGLDYEDHWERMGYTDMYTPLEVIKEIYNLEESEEVA
jgi:hypothetical protein